MLLLRPRGRRVCGGAPAESLQYLVLDEFHTYDGAQGTDVAMLLRRLGLTLKSHWTATTNVSEDDRLRPLGRITPVATSATLGSQTAPMAMLDFAYTVFGEKFDLDAVIEETRLTTDQWLAGRQTARDGELRPIDPGLPEALDRIVETDHTGFGNRTLARAVFDEIIRHHNATGWFGRIRGVER